MLSKTLQVRTCIVNKIPLSNVPLPTNYLSLVDTHSRQKYYPQQGDAKGPIKTHGKFSYEKFLMFPLLPLMPQSASRVNQPLVVPN